MPGYLLKLLLFYLPGCLGSQVSGFIPCRNLKRWLLTILIQVRKSFQRYFSLTDKEMMIILNYFLYGKTLKIGEKTVIDDLLKTKKYFKLLQSLVKNYGEVENDPKKFISSDTPFYNTVTSYRLWRKYDVSGKGRKAMQGMEGLDSKTVGN